jgi:hypothetical protein
MTVDVINEFRNLLKGATHLAGFVKCRTLGNLILDPRRFSLGRVVKSALSWSCD